MATPNLLSLAAEQYKAGHLQEAELTCRQVLSSDPDHRIVRMLLGVIQITLKKFADAANTLEPVATANPDDVEANANYATALVHLERYDEAEPILQRSVELHPENLGPIKNLAIVLQHLENYDRAVEFNKMALAKDPHNFEIRRRIAICELHQMQGRRALNSARAILLEYPYDAELWCTLAQVETRKHHKSNPTDCHRRALVCDPLLQPALISQAQDMTATANADEATGIIRTLVLLDPGSFEHSLRFLSNLAANQRTSDCYEQFRRLLSHGELRPVYWTKRADFMFSLGEISKSKRDTVRSLILDPTNAIGLAIEGRSIRLANQAEAAIEMLHRALMVSPEREQPALALNELGKCYDILGQTDQAFAYFERANIAVSEAMPAKHQFDQMTVTAERYLKIINQLGFKAETIARSEAVRPLPAFMLGFFRSGTTLMDQMLDGHSNIQTLEEKPTLSVVARTLLNQLPDLPVGLGRLDAGSHSLLVNTYFELTSQFIDLDPNKVFVDRNPFYSHMLFLIDYLFPNAPIILAVRHPCDVCLSNLKENYAGASTSWQFSTLDKTTEVYAKTMELVAQCREILNLNIRMVRYEDLVDDTEGVMRDLIEFLGVEWDPSVLDHVATVRKKQKAGQSVRTASRDQVAQPVYKTAVGRWKRYEKFLLPYKDRLMPHIEAFGYSWD